MDKIKQQLMKDIQSVGLPVDFELELRGYSKVYNGRYESKKEKVILYPLKKNGELRDYEVLLRYAIHEAIHHYQWKHDPNFVRIKGVMHNVEFHKLENYYLKRAKELKLLGGFIE